MYGQQSLQDYLFLMLYGGVAILAVIAALYLLFRRANAFAPNVTPPKSLRRWVSAFFIVMALSHVWWYVIGIYWLTDNRLVRIITVTLLDRITFVPLAMGLLLDMLRIKHFEQLYTKTAATSRSVTAQQLAQESGFRNYSTFSAAFKRYKGITVTAWMGGVKD